MSGRRKGALVQMHKPDSQTLLVDRRGEGSGIGRRGVGTGVGFEA